MKVADQFPGHIFQSAARKSLDLPIKVQFWSKDPVKQIEVIRGEKSSDQAVSQIFQLSKQIGKTPIVVKDSPGFLVNRLLMPYLTEAAVMLSSGVPIQELDSATGTYQKITARKNVCNGLPGNVVIANPAGGPVTAFFCNQSCIQ